MDKPIHMYLLTLLATFSPYLMDHSPYPCFCPSAPSSVPVQLLRHCLSPCHSPHYPSLHTPPSTPLPLIPPSTPLPLIPPYTPLPLTPPSNPFPSLHQILLWSHQLTPRHCPWPTISSARARPTTCSSTCSHLWPARRDMSS